MVVRRTAPRLLRSRNTIEAGGGASRQAPPIARLCAILYACVMTATADALIQNAQRAERMGMADQAAHFWAQLEQAFPQHPKTLALNGHRRLAAGDPAGAAALFASAEAGDDADPEIPLFASIALSMLGALPEALGALDRALAIEPYFFPAMLSKGALLERMGRPRQAAQVYGDAVKIAPPVEHMPPAMRAPFEHAKIFVADNAAALAQHLRDRTAAARAQHSGADLSRFEESLDILAGVKQRFVHEPALFYFPRLPAYGYYDRAHFPWLAHLEAATDMIRGELETVLQEDRIDFVPYIQRPPGAPVNQWGELNHSPKWSTFFLWRDGARQDRNCERCPRTTALLESLPIAHQRGFGPTAMFSVLAPGAHIPAHTGSANTRLICHLPLILPGQCSFRVGNETRDWRMGEAWVFDDTIEHEAWNRSDQTRVILIFDIWNPLLTPAERELIETMMTALNEFSAEDRAQYSPR
jgi:aspartate beta-hydroxylase